jgi:hypothetical protein
MTGEQRGRILQVLWPEGAKSKLSVWAILDCARDPKIYLALLESRLEFRCLYSGRLPRELERVSPQLVELVPGNRLVERFLDEGWGRSWGCLLRVDDASNLRPHLRRFLKVRDESGRRLLFRFYDPRVLRNYLPTCTPSELRLFFGPLQAWFIEGPGGRSLIECSFDGTRLRRDQVLLDAAPSPAG